MPGVLRDKSFERFVRLSEFLFLSLRFGQQNICVSGGRCTGVTSDYLFVLLRGIRASQRGRCSGRAPIRIKPITSECNSGEKDDQRGGDDWLFETLQKKTRFQCDIARWRWRRWHKRLVLDQFENWVRVVLCHAKVSRASIAEWGHPRDNALSGDKILAMNAFWNSFETLLGLGVERKNLRFIQISLRGVIVFVVTLITIQLGHKRSLSRKTPFDAALLVILAAVLSRAINGSAAFFATLGGGVVLVVIHRLFAYLAFYSRGFGILAKGRPDVIVRDGQCDLAVMRRNHVSMHDLEEDMRLSAHTDDLPIFDSPESNGAATSASSKNRFDPDGP